ncbi:MAG: hypothetical protein IKK33_03875 [Lachnospiraceae bacterium]|nr:hypothetical protein [Lachnospiraceae bacterium]
MIENVKKINRALLELWIGILFTGLLCQFIGMWFADNKVLYSVALWIGIVLGLITVVHMYRTLDRALDLGAGAQKVVTTANLVRYGCVVIVFLIVLLTDVLNPLITFMGLMSVKVAAYLQPFTHKLCNKVFHEVDPIPEPMPVEEIDDFDSNTDMEEH